MNALVEWDPSNGISTPPFWPPISIRQIPFPHVPGTRRTGKVRKRACGPHTSECNNARMRGSPCPEAWALLVPERVDPKVRTKPHKSQLSPSREASWKRGSTARNPRDFSPGSHQINIDVKVISIDIQQLHILFPAFPFQAGPSATPSVFLRAR